MNAGASERTPSTGSASTGPGRRSDGAGRRSPELEQALMRLDELLRHPPLETSRSGTATPSQRIEQHRSAVLPRSASEPLDRQVIELVTRLFESLLAGFQLPGASGRSSRACRSRRCASAWTSIAVLDSFEHPLWRLLDRIGETSQGYSRSEDPRLSGFLAFAAAVAEEMAGANAPDTAALPARPEPASTSSFRAAAGAAVAPPTRGRRAADRRATRVLQQHLTQRITDQMVAVRTSPTIRRFVTGAWARVIADDMLRHGEQSEANDQAGIGKAIAERLAAEGACVVVADLDSGKAADVAAGIGNADVAVGVGADVSDEAAVAAAIRQAVLAYGGVDLIVNNAGLSISTPLLDTTVRDWDLQHDVMAKGSFLVSREAARVLVEQRMGGDIVYISSKNSLFAGPNNIAYGATKADQAHQVRLLAAELGSHGVRVNGINPDGVVRGSGIFAGGWGAKRAEVYGVPEDQLGEYYAQRTLLKREVLPEHVAAAVFALTGPDLSQTTGLHIPVDSGVAAAFLR